MALSNSGETDELLGVLETIRRLGAKLIAITGGPRSTLAQAADVALDCSVAEEACPMNLVPTASTTAALAIGDALAMTLCVEKGFRQEDFASLHPGGKLGKRLKRVEALMHAGRQCPIVNANTPMRDVIYEMSSKGLGMTCVVDGAGDDAGLLGIITDGDLRHMERGAVIRHEGGRRDDAQSGRGAATRSPPRRRDHGTARLPRSSSPTTIDRASASPASSTARSW